MNSNLTQSIAQKRGDLEVSANQKDQRPWNIIEEIDEHLQAYSQRPDEEPSFGEHRLSIPPQSAIILLKFLLVWLRLHSQKEQTTYIEKKCFFFYVWKLQGRLIAPMDYLDHKWEQQKSQLAQQKRYPFSEMKKQKQHIEVQLFDVERKQFFKQRHKYILTNLFRNANRKYRLLKVVGFHKFLRNIALYTSSARASNSVNSISRRQFPPSLLQQYNHQPPAPDPLPKAQQGLQYSRSKSPISRHQSQKVSGVFTNRKQQNMLKGSIYISQILLNNYRQKKHLAFLRWFALAKQWRQDQLVDELKQINIILNERVFRENVFRTKIKLVKQDIESKILLSTQLLFQLIQAQK